MIKTNEDIIKSWMEGKLSEGKGLKTNGNDLFSFGLKIGYTVQEDDVGYGTMKRVYGYTGEFFVSNTTSKHVRMALKMIGLKEDNASIPPDGLKQRVANAEIREKIRNRSRPDMYR